MLHPLVQAATSPHDAGVRQVAALSARISYVTMCVALCWGVFVSTGWIRRLTGRQATRSSHMVFATLAIAFGLVHVMCFLFLTDVHFDVIRLAVPMAENGELRWAFGIVGFEVIIALAVSTGLQRFFTYRRWLQLHRFAYPALGLIIVHSFFGAIANGHLATVWLAGLTVLVPTAMISLLRFMPPRVLTGAGLVEEDA